MGPTFFKCFLFLFVNIQVLKNNALTQFLFSLYTSGMGRKSIKFHNMYTQISLTEKKTNNINFEVNITFF